MDQKPPSRKDDPTPGEDGNNAPNANVPTNNRHAVGEDTTAATPQVDRSIDDDEDVMLLMSAIVGVYIGGGEEDEEDNEDEDNNVIRNNADNNDDLSFCSCSCSCHNDNDDDEDDDEFYDEDEDEDDEDDDEDEGRSSSSSRCGIVQLWKRAIQDEEDEDDDDNDDNPNGRRQKLSPEGFFVRETDMSDCCVEYLQEQTDLTPPSERLKRLGLGHARQPTDVSGLLQEWVLQNAPSLEGLTLFCDQHNPDDEDDNNNNGNPTLPDEYVRLLPQLPRLSVLRLGGYDLSGSEWFPQRILRGLPDEGADNENSQGEPEEEDDVPRHQITNLKLLHCSLPTPDCRTALAEAFRTYNRLEQISLHGCGLGNAATTTLLNGMADNPGQSLRFLDLQMNHLSFVTIGSSNDNNPHMDGGVLPALTRLLRQQRNLMGLDVAANDGLLRIPPSRRHKLIKTPGQVPQIMHDFFTVVATHPGLQDLNLGSCGVNGTNLSVLLQALNDVTASDVTASDHNGRGGLSLQGLHLSGNEHLHVEECWTQHLPRLALHHMCFPVRASPDGCPGELCLGARRLVGRRLLWNALKQNTLLRHMTVTNALPDPGEEEEDRNGVDMHHPERQPPLVTQDEVDSLMERNENWRRVAQAAPTLRRVHWAPLLHTLLQKLHRQEGHGGGASVAYMLLHTKMPSLLSGSDEPPVIPEDGNDNQNNENEQEELEEVD